MIPLRTNYYATYYSAEELQATQKNWGLMTSTILLDMSEAPNADKLKDHSRSETLKSTAYTPSDSTIYVHPAIFYYSLICLTYESITLYSTLSCPSPKLRNSSQARQGALNSWGCWGQLLCLVWWEDSLKDCSPCLMWVPVLLQASIQKSFFKDALFASRIIKESEGWLLGAETEVGKKLT